MTLNEQIRSNNLRTFLLFAGFGVLMAAVGMVAAATYDPGLLGFVGIFAIGYALISWFASGSMVAAAAGAEPVTREQAPRLHRAVEVTAIGAGLDRTPDVYVIHDSAPNAFAAGRDLQHAYVAATTGLLEMMDDRELEAVMAHEMAHVRNRDVRLMTIAAILVGIVALVSDMLLRSMIWGGRSNRQGGHPAMVIVAIVLMVLAPIAAAVMQMTISRRREFLADATAVEITGDAGALASALAKLGRDLQPLRNATKATAPMYIQNPLRDHRGLRSSLAGMFDTHPPLRRRIEQVCQMGGLDPREYVVPDLERGS